jgi:4-amino-4-deoxy-L-arabinose transferase-like glycosyltransferase
MFTLGSGGGFQGAGTELAGKQKSGRSRLVPALFCSDYCLWLLFVYWFLFSGKTPRSSGICVLLCNLGAENLPVFILAAKAFVKRMQQFCNISGALRENLSDVVA